MPEKRTTGQKVINSLVLKPLSLAYGAITAGRNKLFDIGVLTQREFDIPILVVGNITVGGTGKTPHTEYLIELLCDKYKIGVLSRGYNRKTKGFIVADDDATASTIGDEPLQIYRKYADSGVMVAVCEDRCKGIDKMRELRPDLNLIILDDAFQHRYVKPSVSVVLMEYQRPVFADSMLPAGRLRESIGALHRSDIVIITKCPADMKQLEYRLFVKNLNLYPYQKLYFSTYEYSEPQPVFSDNQTAIPSLSFVGPGHHIIALAGVAHPMPFIRHLRTSGAKVKGMVFPDHHNFSIEDVATVISRIKSSPDPAHTIVITTEKDAMRLRTIPNLPKSFRNRLYYIPINVRFIPNVAEGAQANERDFDITIQQLLNRAKR